MRHLFLGRDGAGTRQHLRRYDSCTRRSFADKAVKSTVPVHLLIKFFNHFWFQHDSAPQRLYLLLWRHYNLLFYYLQKVKYKLQLLKIRMGIKRITAISLISEDPSLIKIFRERQGRRNDGTDMTKWIPYSNIRNPQKGYSCLLADQRGPRGYSLPAGMRDRRSRDWHNDRYGHAAKAWS